MKAKPIFLLWCLMVSAFGALPLQAQINTAALINPHVSTHAARYLPSKLGTGCRRGEVHLLNNYTWLSNNALGYKSISDLVFSELITDQDAARFIKQMKNTNNIFFGTELQLFSVAFNVKHKKKNIFALRFDHRERVYGNFQYGNNLFKLALEGNKQFAGKGVNLGPVRLNAMYIREFNAGVAVPIAIKKGKNTFELRPAVTGKYIQGMAGIYTRTGDVNMFTDKDGRFINFTFDYDVNYALPFGIDRPDVRSALTGSGSGWGVDAGLGFSWNDLITVDAALVDLGRIRFSGNPTNYRRTGNYRFEGVEVLPFNDEEGNKQFDLDYAQDVFDPVTSNQAYTTGMGAKMIIHTTVRLGRKEFATKRDLRRDSTMRRVFHRHHFAFTYVQGLENAYNATVIPNVSFAYMYSLRNILNLGMSVGVGGYNKVAFGPILSLKAGPVVATMGSNNLTALIAPKVGTGADFYFNVGFNF